MNIEDLPDESDSSDEDYVPVVKPDEQVSEVDSDGDPEDPLSDAENTTKIKGKKRRKQSNHGRKKSRSSNEVAEESMLI